MVALELATGQLPMPEKQFDFTVLAAMFNGERPAFPPGMDRGLAALMVRCWAQDPKARPTAEALVEALMAMDHLHVARAAVDSNAASLGTSDSTDAL